MKNGSKLWLIISKIRPFLFDFWSVIKEKYNFFTKSLMSETGETFFILDET